MVFSTQWEENQYAQDKQVVLYPFSDVVSLVTKFICRDGLPACPKVLEIGCGTGPNIQFFLDMGWGYYGLDGAQSAVAFINNRFGDRVDVHCHDFSEEWPFGDGVFDLVFDRSAVTHNRTEDIPGILQEAWRVLRPEARFLGVDWFSAESQISRGNGQQDWCSEDYGVFHFFSEEEIRELFDEKFWKLLYLRLKRKHQIFPDTSVSSHYDLLVSKK